MKLYDSPVIRMIYYGQNDVVRTSGENFMDSDTQKDTDVVWGGNW